jgi:hypothetical protein
MKEKERLGKQAQARSLKILLTTLSLIVVYQFINIITVDAGPFAKELRTEVSFGQPTYRNSTASHKFDEHVRNQMFGRHNCLDSELGDLTDSGFPPEPTRTNESIYIYQLLQEDISNYFVYQKEMHNKIITVAFKKDYVIEEERKEYLSEFIFNTWGRYWKEFGGFAFESYTVMFGDNLSLYGNAFPTGFQTHDPLTHGIAHEMYHAWNGGSFRQEGERLWFMEGVTVYYDIRHQEDEYNGCPISTSYDWYLSDYFGEDRAIGDLSITDPAYPQNAQFIANKGSIIAFLLDKELEKSGHHIGEVSRLLFQRYGIESMGYPTNDEILRTFNEVSGKDFTDFFNRYIYGSERLPVPENFDRVCHDCTNPRPTIRVNNQYSPVTILSGTDVNVDISLNAFDQAGLNADWWIAESNPSGWSTFVYPTGWQTGISPCIQTPLFDLIPAFGVPNNPSPEGNKTFYFAIDNNADRNPDVTWYDHVNLNVLESIFPCNTVPIPKRDIIIDGLADDWNGISPYVNDPQNDSLCSEGTDIKDVYLATDGSNLFWRIDTWSGKYEFDNNNGYYSLAYNAYPSIWSESQVTWNGQGGLIVGGTFDGTIPIIAMSSGSEYGKADKTLEGKIPIRFLFEDNIQGVQLILSYYYVPPTKDQPPSQCDLVVVASHYCN